MTKSHQPSGFGWSRVGCLFSTPFLFNPSGFNPKGRGFNPKGRGLSFPLPCTGNPIQILPLDFCYCSHFCLFPWNLDPNFDGSWDRCFLKYSNAFWVANRSQVGSKIVSKIDLGWVSGGPGRLLAAKTEKREELPILGGHLGAALGASWGRLGVVLGGSGVQDGA